MGFGRCHKSNGPAFLCAGSWALQLHQLAGPDDATKTVDFWLDQGGDNFKAYMFITPAELSAAVATAHKRGAKVTGHLCSIGFREAASIGVDNLEHGLLVDTEFFPWKKPGECPEKLDYEFISKLDVQSGPLHDTILDLVQHHVAVTSTLPVSEMIVPGRPTIQQRILDALSPDARSAVLNNKVRASDASVIRQRYHADSSPWPAAFKKQNRSIVDSSGFFRGLGMAGKIHPKIGDFETWLTLNFRHRQPLPTCSSISSATVGRVWLPGCP